MTMEDERNFDLLVAELEYENRLMRARNERLARTLEGIQSETGKLKATVAHIVALSQLAFRGDVPQAGVEEHDDKAGY